jgi:hypothetical protein
MNTRGGRGCCLLLLLLLLSDGLLLYSTCADIPVLRLTCSTCTPGYRRRVSSSVLLPRSINSSSDAGVRLSLVVVVVPLLLLLLLLVDEAAILLLAVIVPAELSTERQFLVLAVVNAVHALI